MDNKLYITKAGRQAEREALANGRQIKVVRCHVDSMLLSALSNPEDLTEVQKIPSDQDGKQAIYAIAGESFPDRVVISWKLPKESGAYDVNGLGFILEDGTLWAYQRMPLGYKPNPDEGAASDINGTAVHKTDNATSITINMDLSQHHATISDVEFYIRTHEKEMRKLMRKVEGNLGTVKIFMDDRDIDEGYIPIRGQLLQKRDYPDYFRHLGITSDSLRLPDWAKYPYLRQFSDSLEAGHVLNDEIRSHTHNGKTYDAGGHTPQAYTSDLGTRNARLTLNGRFGTDYAGSHSHNGRSSQSGNHNHGASVSSSGNHNHSGSATSAGSHNHRQWVNKGNDVNMDYGYRAVGTDDTFGSGRYSNDRTETAGSHSHGLSINHAGSHSHSASISYSGSHSHTIDVYSGGSHNHYVDVNFGTKTIPIQLGSVNVNMQPVRDHKHGLVIDHSGGSETRPKSTAVVYAVKAKYITQLLN